MDLPPIRQLSREQLYALVWKTPRSVLAKSFGITGVAIAKRCKKLQVPAPPLGYWQKVTFGQTPPQTPLPPYVRRGDIEVGTVRIESETKLIRVSFGDGQTYDLPASGLRNAPALVALVFQLRGQPWATGEHLKDFVDCVAAWAQREKLKSPAEFYSAQDPAT